MEPFEDVLRSFDGKLRGIPKQLGRVELSLHRNLIINGLVIRPQPEYLPSGTIDKIRDGTIRVIANPADGSVVGHYEPSSKAMVPPKRVWNMPSHNAETGGTNMLSKLIPNRRFDYPKSLYAVEDIWN